MSARAIWQGTLAFKQHEIAVKLYSAVWERQIHFHLLHNRDSTRVQQRMVDSRTGEPVALDEALKAYEAEPGVYVTLTREELAKSESKASREIRVRRFVPTRAIDPQLFDHPYDLGPDAGSTADYFALAAVLEQKSRAGIARWVMRKHSYVGALIAHEGYLVLSTLRYAEEVIAVSELDPPDGEALESKERALAGKLIESLASRFEPDLYHDLYQQRVHDLIEAKRTGRKIKPKRAATRRRRGSLADALLASLKAVSTKRHV